MFNPLKRATYNPTKYGLVPNDQVFKDPALGDPELAAALSANRTGDWKPAAVLMESVGTDWDRRGLYANAFANMLKEDPGAAWLQNWRQADPRSADAAVVHAQALVVKAWAIRGARRANATSKAQFRGFHQVLNEAATAAMTAAELAPDDPTPWMTMVTAARGLQFSNTKFERIWNELITRDLHNRRGHTQALQYWMPKWFGSNPRARQFVDEAVMRAPKSALAFELRVHFAHERWLQTANLPGASSKMLFFRWGLGRRLLKPALADFWTGDVPSGGGYAAVDRNLLAWALTMTRRYDEACEVWLQLGGCVNDGYPWQYYMNAPAAFKRMRREAFVKSSRKPIA